VHLFRRKASRRRWLLADWVTPVSNGNCLRILRELCGEKDIERAMGLIQCAISWIILEFVA
jgi:hypothetical protein